MVPAAALIPAFFLDEKADPFKSADQDETSEHTPLLASKDNTSDFILPAITSRVFQYALILRCFRNPSFSVTIILCAIYAVQLAAFDATVPIEAANCSHLDRLIPASFSSLLHLQDLLLDP